MSESDLDADTITSRALSDRTLPDTPGASVRTEVRDRGWEMPRRRWSRPRGPLLLSPDGSLAREATPPTTRTPVSPTPSSPTMPALLHGRERVPLIDHAGHVT